MSYYYEVGVVLQYIVENFNNQTINTSCRSFHATSRGKERLSLFSGHDVYCMMY